MKIKGDMKKMIMTDKEKQKILAEKQKLAKKKAEALKRQKAIQEELDRIQQIERQELHKQKWEEQRLKEEQRKVERDKLLYGKGLSKSERFIKLIVWISQHLDDYNGDYFYIRDVKMVKLSPTDRFSTPMPTHTKITCKDLLKMFDIEG